MMILVINKSQILSNHQIKSLSISNFHYITQNVDIYKQAVMTYAHMSVRHFYAT